MMDPRQRYTMNEWGEMTPLADVSSMHMPVKCTMCSHVYDLQGVHVTARYTDCSVWKCPGCGITVDDRPKGWGAHHYVNLDRDGREVRDR